MPVNNRENAKTDALAARDALERIRQQLAIARVRHELAARRGDRSLLDQARDRLERSVRPQTKTAVREAGSVAQDIKSDRERFRQARKAQSVSRKREPSRD